MRSFHNEDYGAYELEYAAGEYSFYHFSDPDRIARAVILMAEDVAQAMALEILHRSAPHLLAGYRAKVEAVPGGNVVQFRRA